MHKPACEFMFKVVYGLFRNCIQDVRPSGGGTGGSDNSVEQLSKFFRLLRGKMQEEGGAPPQVFRRTWLASRIQNRDQRRLTGTLYKRKAKLKEPAQIVQIKAQQPMLHWNRCSPNPSSQSP
jgi:hypothetical protein